MKTIAGTKIKDLTGLKFGFYTVASFDGSVGGKSYWNCRCDCGKVNRVLQYLLTGGRSKSCGCKRREMLIEKSNIGGLSDTPEYFAWKSMQKRCNAKTGKNFRLYGSRGICVCERWLNFSNFMQDMGNRPSGLHSLDRINNDGNYEPSNCRWAIPEIQQNNKRTCVKITVGSETMTRTQWERRAGIKPGTINDWQRQGVPMAEISSRILTKAAQLGF